MGVLSSPLESPEGSALLGLGLGQGLPWGRSPCAGSWIGGSPPARGARAEDGAGDVGVTGDGDAGGGTDGEGIMRAGDGAGVLSGVLTGAEVQTTVVLGQDTGTLTESSLLGQLHIEFSGLDASFTSVMTEDC